MLKVVCLARAYNSLWFPHLANFFSVTFLLPFLSRDVIRCIIIFVIHCDSNAMKNGNILFPCIRIFPGVRTGKLPYLLLPLIWFYVSVPWISCMIVLSQAGASIGSKQDTNQDPPPPHEHNAKEINTNEVFIEEIIHWYFHPLPPQSLVVLLNKNKTLQYFPPLGDLCISFRWDI